MPLTELQIKKAKPTDRPYKLADGEGLFLLVQPNGSKLWRLKYRIRGKEKLLSFGAYPEVGIAAARERKNSARAKLDEGRDPMVHKADCSLQPSSTFRSIAKLWHANRETSLNPDHATRVWSRMENDVFPFLGERQIQDITPPDVLEMIRKIEERGALDISRRAKQGVGQVFQFAIASGLATSDPTAHLRGALKPRPRVKHMSKIPIGELPAFIARLSKYEADGARRTGVTRSAVMFALLTWVRTKELRFARKDEFEGLDGPAPLWRIGADRMKMGREHLVPLSAQATSIARSMIEESPSDFVFPGTKPNQALSENTMIYALYRLGYIGRQTVHGFRGLASTWANEQLVEMGNPGIWMRRYHEDWVELQLAHAEENEVRGAYNAAEYMAPRRRMLQDWADFVSEQHDVGLAKIRAIAA